MEYLKQFESREPLAKQFTALIIADSFDYRFLPLTLEVPRTLLPIFDKPLLDYTFEFLLKAGIRDIVLLTCSHSKRIKDHVATSPVIAKYKSELSLKIITTQKGHCTSQGDAVRGTDNDFKTTIQDNFILVDGYIITNVNLEQLLAQHLEFRKKQESVMTMLLKTNYLNGKQKNADSYLGYFCDPVKRRVKKITQLDKYDPVITLKKNSDFGAVEFRTDYVDTGMYICSRQILFLYSEHFDAHTAIDLLQYLLSPESVVGVYNVNYIMIDDQYISLIRDIKTYYDTHFDLLLRYAYPLVPSTTKFELYSNFVYIGRGSMIADNTELFHTCLIGQKSHVGFNTELTNFVTGSECSIGDNCHIDNSILFDNVKVGENCVIKNSLIASNVTIEPMSIIISNSIISFGVTVPTKSFLTGRTMLSNLNQCSVGSFEKKSYYFIDIDYFEKEAAKKNPQIKNTGSTVGASTPHRTGTLASLASTTSSCSSTNVTADDLAGQISSMKPLFSHANNVSTIDGKKVVMSRLSCIRIGNNTSVRKSSSTSGSGFGINKKRKLFRFIDESKICKMIRVDEELYNSFKKVNFDCSQFEDEHKDTFFVKKSDDTNKLNFYKPPVGLEQFYYWADHRISFDRIIELAEADYESSSSEDEQVTEETLFITKYLTDNESYHNDALQIIYMGVNENKSQHNIMIELNCLKHTYNCGYEEIISNIITCCLEILFPFMMCYDLERMNTTFATYYPKLIPIIVLYVTNTKSSLEALDAIEDYFYENSKIANESFSRVKENYLKILSLLNKNLIFSDEIILLWNQNSLSNNNLTNQEIDFRNSSIGDFLSWLEGSDEEDDDEEEEDDE